MNMVRNSVKSGAKFGSHKMVFTSGGPDLPEPIGLKLVPIDVALKGDFLQRPGSEAVVTMPFTYY